MTLSGRDVTQMTSSGALGGKGAGSSRVHVTNAHLSTSPSASPCLCMSPSLSRSLFVAHNRNH